MSERAYPVTDRRTERRGRKPKEVAVNTRGQQLLMSSAFTLAEVARRIGASISAVQMWRVGEARPHESYVVRLEAELGIPAIAWRERPRPAPPSSSSRPAPPAPPPPAEAPPRARPAPAPPRPPLAELEAPLEASASSRPTAPALAELVALEAPPVAEPPLELEPPGNALAECLRMLAHVRRDLERPGLLPGERAKLVTASARLLKQRDDLERAAELTEDRYVREHPGWIRVRSVIVAALERYPAAAHAVAEALAELERD